MKSPLSFLLKQLNAESEQTNLHIAKKEKVKHII